MMKKTSLVALLLLGPAFMLAAPASAPAQTPSLPTSLPGRVSAPVVDSRDNRLPPADRQCLVAKADALFARLLATPSLARPIGFAVSRAIVVAPPPDGMPQWHPSRALGTMLLRAVNPADGSRPDANGAYGGAGEGPSIRFAINDLTALFQFPEEGRTDRPKYFDFPYADKDFGGFPVLRFSSRTHIVIARPGHVPFRHVTRQALIEREIGDLREPVARLGEANAPQIVAQIRRLEAELAALSPAERQAPACRNMGRGKSLLAPCGGGAPYVVTPNSDYFTRSASRAAVQLIVLSVPQPGGVGHKVLEPITRAAVDALDLEALQAVLE